MNGFQDHLKHIEGLELISDKSKLILSNGNARCTLRGNDGIGTELNIPFDDNLFSRHLLFLGNIGTGKTVAISQIVSQIKNQMTEEDIMIIFDTKGDFYNQFYKEGDIVLSNNVSRFKGEFDYWNIFNEIVIDKSEQSIKENALEIANTLFADRIKKSNAPFFPQAAKDILATFLAVCAKENAMKDNTNEGLSDFFENSDRANIQGFFEHFHQKKISSYISKDASSQADGVIAELNQLVGEIFIGDFRRRGNLSIRELVRKKGAKTIFVEYDITLGSVLAPIYRLLIDLAIKEGMSKKETKGNVWVFIDEFRLIPNLQHIDNGINFGRSQGLKFILGIQNIPQVHNEYGEALAESLMSGLSTIISFRVDDSKSREFIQNRYGYALKKMVYKRAGQVSQGQISEEIRPSKVIEDWDISRLPIGTAIIGLPGANPFIFKFNHY